MQDDELPNPLAVPRDRNRKVRSLKLPSKLSDLLRVALADLRAAEQSRGYVVDMTKWHSPGPDGDVCFVCLAGSMLVQILDSGEYYYPTDEVEHEKLDTDTKRKLMAVDLLRCGRAHLAYLMVHGVECPVESDAIDRVIPPYDSGPTAWHGSMADLLANLERNRL